MHPILFEIRGFPVYTYGLLLAAAYLLGLQFALVRARTRGLDPNRVMDLGIWIIVSALVGAKLLLLVVEFDKFGRTRRSS
jgi:phosphatidylglycerol:prolipoprotein diacylglycerol transferase